MAVIKYPLYKKYSFWTLVLFTAGGMILGPVVQYYAFGDLWTGIPFGWDLTDNKTLIALIFWILAVVYEQEKRQTCLYNSCCSCTSSGIFNTSQFVWFTARLCQRTGNPGNYP